MKQQKILLIAFAVLICITSVVYYWTYLSAYAIGGYYADEPTLYYCKMFYEQKNWGTLLNMGLVMVLLAFTNLVIMIKFALRKENSKN